MECMCHHSCHVVHAVVAPNMVELEHTGTWLAQVYTFVGMGRKCFMVLNFPSLHIRMCTS